MQEEDVKFILSALGSTKFQRSADNIITNCPLAQWTHGRGTDRSPSFSIRVGSGDSPWKCWSCQSTGTMRGLLYQYSEKSGVDVSNLRSLVNQQVGPPKLSSRMEKIPDYSMNKAPPQALKHDGAWFAVAYETKFDFEEFKHMCEIYVEDYLQSRNVDEDLFLRWRLGYCEKSQRIFIPFFDYYGKFVGYSKRAVHHRQVPKYLNAKGMANGKYFYGEWLWNLKKKTVHLVEGQFDAIRLDRAGLVNSLAMVGNTVKEDQLIRLSQRADKLIVFPDNDAWPRNPNLDPFEEEFDHKKLKLPPGISMLESLKRDLESNRLDLEVEVVPFISGKKDVDQWTENEIQIQKDRRIPLKEIDFDDIRKRKSFP